MRPGAPAILMIKDEPSTAGIQPIKKYWSTHDEDL